MAGSRKIIMSARDIERSLSRIALQITEANRELDSLAIIGIHTGGVFLAKRVQETIQAREQIKLPLGTLDITLYRDDWSRITANPIVKTTDIPFAVEEKTIVLVDDVLFTGRTIRAALDAVIDYGRPSMIQLAVLIDRGGRELPIQPDYTGLEVEVGANQHIHVLLDDSPDRDEVVIESVAQALEPMEQ